MVGFCTSARYVEHDTGPHHPERPDRIRAVARAVREAGLVASPDPFPEFRIDLGIAPVGGERLLELEPTAADEKWLSLVHSAEQIRHAKEICEAGGGVLDQGDTPVGENSYEIAMLSLGGVLRACDAVMTGEVQRAFAAVRPPGHHAEPNRAMGFCLFSNIAIAARYIQKQYGVKRIAIVDFDVHHGNGTQAAFEADPSVVFISLHQHPRTIYPGTGYEWETGVSAGRGYTLNIPMNPGLGDDAYMQAMQDKVLPALDAFAPEIILVSAGFDAHCDDPLAEMNVSDTGFAQMTRLLVTASERHCGGKLVSALEGGYNLVALGRSVVRHLVALQTSAEQLAAVLIVDAHLDLSYNVQRGRDVRLSAKDQAITDNEIPTVGLPDLKAGGIGLICATIFCSPATYRKTGYVTADDAHAMAVRQLDWYRQQMRDGLMTMVTAASSLPVSLSPSLPFILLLEGADAFRSPADVKMWFDWGLRIVGLSWRQNRMAGGTGFPGPLSEEGRSIVRAMDELSMIHDASHLAEESFWQLLETTAGPVMASHSNCQAIVPGDRQLSDDMIKAIAKRNGVIGINFYDEFLLPPSDYKKRKARMSDLLDHINRMCDLAGNAHHVALGTDMDGGVGRDDIPQELRTSADLPKIAIALSEAGFPDADVTAIMSGNWLNFFKRNLPR